MIYAIDATFFAAVAFFVAAGFTSYMYFRSEGEAMLIATRRVVAVAAVLMTFSFFLRWAAYGRIPLTEMVDILNVLLVMSAAIILPLVKRESLRPLLCYYAPPLAVLAAFNAIAGYGRLHHAPKELNDAFVAFHVGLAFLAYALFFVASLTSFVYIVQARRLKSLQTTARMAKLPPLEHLDATLFRLIKVGYPFFAITLILGFIGAYLYRDELGTTWWLSAKIFYAFFMAALYSFAFHSRRLGLLRGQRLAYVVVIGFAVMLALYMLLGVTGLKDYGFWSQGA